MLHEALAGYLEKVERTVQQCRNAYIESYTEELLSPERINLRIRIRFEKGYLLEINEAVIVSENLLAWLDYRYHFQDEQNVLIFRYDSTPHFPDLPNFPHHKHLPDHVISSIKPDVKQVIHEAVEINNEANRLFLA